MAFVTSTTDLGGTEITLEVLDVEALVRTGFQEIEIESVQDNTTIVVAKAPLGTTKFSLDNDDNIRYYKLPKFVSKT